MDRNLQPSVDFLQTLVKSSGADWPQIEVLIDMSMTRWWFVIVPLTSEEIPLQHA